VLDFTSALYLGLRHPSTQLRPWTSLTSGVPAALAEAPEAARIGSALATLMGVERATLARSTLHAFWDLFATFGTEPRRIYVDAGAYPIARAGAERAMARGVHVQFFPHHDPDELRRRLRRDARLGPLWVVADGYCTGCGRAAPIVDFAAIAAAAGGRLVIDDTQAMGVLGHGATPAMPYGYGGGGSLRMAGVGSGVLLVASLAKGFGAPLAVIGGPAALITRFEQASDMRVHASPPTVADLRSAERAIAINASRGDSLRHRLMSLVRQFRHVVRDAGGQLGGSLFPVQWIAGMVQRRAIAVYQRLRQLGVAAVLRHSPCRAAEDLVFVITATHSRMDIEQLAICLRAASMGIA